MHSAHASPTPCAVLQLAMSDFDSTSLACHWAALPVESATSSAAPEEQPQLLCLQAAANPELYLTAEEAAQGDAEDPKRKAGLSARPWAGGSAQSWTFMPVSSSLVRYLHRDGPLH